jgi:dihydropyrimidinase
VSRTLVRGGTLLDSGGRRRADLLVHGERIAAVGLGFAEAEEVIDATGLLVMPGGVDVHTHMQRDGSTADDMQSGTMAAAWGGTTTIVDMATQDHGESLRAGLERWHGGAQGAHIDYGFHLIMRDVTTQTLAEVPAIVAEGVPSLKLFMADSGGRYMVDDGALFRAMQVAAGCGGTIMVHAENGPVIAALVADALAAGSRAPIAHALTRPSTLEGEAVRRAVALAELAGAPLYIVHLSSADALAGVREARDRGLPVRAETCPHYLLLDMSDLDRPDFDGARYVCSPPLRGAPDREDLWRGLRGDDLAVVATDHCPWCFTPDRQRGRDDFSLIPNGLAGVEHRLELLWHFGVVQGRISEERFVDVVATAPARLFGLQPRKGSLAPGADADIVLFDPAAEHVISAATAHMRVDVSVYEGFRCTGQVRTVLLRGRTLVRDREWVGGPPSGTYLPRSAA